MSKKLTTEISNEEFWRDLGIDLEKHDELMKVLPVVYQDVYLSQTKRPKGIAYFDNFIADIHGARPKEVFERKKKGGEKMIMTFPEISDFQNLRYVEINEQDLKILAQIIPPEKREFFPKFFSRKIYLSYNRSNSSNISFIRAIFWNNYGIAFFHNFLH